MIASLRGTIAYITPQLRKDAYVVIDVSGVGYKVFVPTHVANELSIDASVILYTHLAVGETVLDLYGFLSPAEKTFFVLLLTVPGIGPKSALGILDKTTMQEVHEAVMADDPELLVTTSGLTAKTAEKIVVALKDKIASLSPAPASGQKASSRDADAIAVLIAFGYSASEARAALDAVDGSIDSTGERVRAALKQIAKK